MESPKESKLRRLSFEFSRDVNKDEVKRCILPSKWLLEGMLAWPDTDKTYVLIFNWFCFFNLAAAEIFHVAYLFANVADLKKVTAACTTVVTTFEAAVRIFIIISKRQVLNNIIYKIWRVFWPVSIAAPEKLRAMKLRMYIALALNFGFLATSCISNTQITGVPLLKYDMILKSVFPFQWNQTYVFEAIYIWHYCADWYVLFMVNAFDFLLIGVVTICSIQYMVLQEVFRHMLSDQFKEHKVLLFGKDAEKLTDMEVVIRCLEQHKELNAVCEQLETAFQFIILIQFFNSTIAICVSSIVLKIDVHQLIQMLMFLAAHLLQLLYYCSAGNELTFQSAHLADAIYESNWHLSYDKEFRRVLLLMMQRSQRKQCLTAAGVTELDFASYLKVMRISFSFYTVLDTLMKKK